MRAAKNKALPDVLAVLISNLDTIPGRSIQWKSLFASLSLCDGLKDSMSIEQVLEAALPSLQLDASLPEDADARYGRFYAETVNVPNGWAYSIIFDCFKCACAARPYNMRCTAHLTYTQLAKLRVGDSSAKNCSKCGQLIYPSYSLLRRPEALFVVLESRHSCQTLESSFSLDYKGNSIRYTLRAVLCSTLSGFYCCYTFQGAKTMRHDWQGDYEVQGPASETVAAAGYYLDVEA